MNSNDPEKALSPSEKAQLDDLANKIVRPEFEKKPLGNKQFNTLIAKIETCNQAVRRQAQPIIDAGGVVPTDENKLSMQHHLLLWYSEAFGLALSKEELVAALAWVWTSTAMQTLFPEKLGKTPKI